MTAPQKVTGELFYLPDTLHIGAPARELFGGWLFKLQMVEWWRPCVIAFFAMLLSPWLLRRCPRALRWTVIGFATALSAAISLRLCQGWDELFIGLKHAQNLAEHGRYTYALFLRQ